MSTAPKAILRRKEMQHLTTASANKVGPTPVIVPFPLGYLALRRARGMKWRFTFFLSRRTAMDLLVSLDRASGSRHVVGPFSACLPRWAILKGKRYVRR